MTVASSRRSPGHSHTDMTTQRNRLRRLVALVVLLLALGLAVATLVWWPFSGADHQSLVPATAAGTGDGHADGPPPVAIRSEVLGALRPGVLTPVRLHLRNTTGSPVAVNRIRVEVTKVEAPRATDRLPCTTDDFAVRQLDRKVEIRLGGGETATVGGELDDGGPALGIAHRGVNQDGCWGAVVRLAFSAQDADQA